MTSVVLEMHVCVSFSLFGSFEKYQFLNFVVHFCRGETWLIFSFVLLINIYIIYEMTKCLKNICMNINLKICCTIRDILIIKLWFINRLL